MSLLENHPHLMDSLVTYIRNLECDSDALIKNAIKTIETGKSLDKIFKIAIDQNLFLRADDAIMWAVFLFGLPNIQETKSGEKFDDSKKLDLPKAITFITTYYNLWYEDLVEDTIYIPESRGSTPSSMGSHPKDVIEKMACCDDFSLREEPLRSKEQNTPPLSKNALKKLKQSQKKTKQEE